MLHQLGVRLRQGAQSILIKNNLIVDLVEVKRGCQNTRAYIFLRFSCYVSFALFVSLAIFPQALFLLLLTTDLDFTLQMPMSLPPTTNRRSNKRISYLSWVILGIKIRDLPRDKLSISVKSRSTTPQYYKTIDSTFRFVL